MCCRETAVLAGFFVVFSGAGVDADTLLTVNRVREIRSDQNLVELKDYSGSVWISGGGARIDEPGISFIMPGAGDVLFIVDHDKKTKEIVRLPASLESVVSEQERAGLSDALGFFSSNATVEKTEDAKNWNEKTAQVYRIVSRSSLAASEAEVWVVDDFEINDLPYRQVLKNIYSLDIRKQWMRRVLELEGFIVRVAVREVLPRSVVVTETTEIVSVQETDGSEGRYEPPEDYQEIPLDTSRWYVLSKGKPLP